MPPATEPCGPYPKLLPQNDYIFNSQIYAAYETCLWLERQAVWDTYPDELQNDSSERIMLDIDPVVAARVLGFGLLYAPNDAGRCTLVRDINACDENQELLAGLVHLCVYGLIFVFYNPSSPTPAVVTPDWSPQLSLEVASRGLHLLEPSYGSTYRLLQLALIDDHRCIFSGSVDVEWATPPRPQALPQTTSIAFTFLAHIISQSLSDSYVGITQAVRDKFSWAKTAGAMIERFGGFSAHDVLGGDSLQSPKNAFTASYDLHAYFDNLDVWLTPAKDEEGELIFDTYDVHHYLGWEFLRLLSTPVKERAQFQSRLYDDQIIPAPDPSIFAIHAACAQIAHMPGAAEYLKEIYRDTDDIALMTEPNAANELSRALKTLQATSTTA